MGYFNRDIASPHAMLEVAHRRIDAAQTVQLFGFNRTIETTYETVWNNGGGIYTFPSSAVTLSIVSSSASDVGNAVFIAGLDEDYNEISDLVVLNGLTPVSSNKSFFRINTFAMGVGNNVGNIVASSSGTEYGYIQADLGTSQGIIYTVPAGHSMYVLNAHFTSGTVNPNKFLYSRGHTISSTGRSTKFWESTFATNIVFDLQVPFRIPEKTDFTIEAKSSSANNELSVYLGCVLMEDDL